MAIESRADDEFDVAVVGGGLVGVATAWGLSREGCRVVILDEGDRAVRASRGNFALVWVQSKGLGLAPYAGWTIRSSNAWRGFSDLLKQETGLDVSFQRPGGFHLCLSEKELEARANVLKRLHNQPGIVDYKTEILTHDQVKAMLPDIGPEVVGGSFCPLDGHVNSLRLFRTLHAALNARGVTYLPSHRVEAITREAGEFRLATPHGEIRAAKVALAAGNANMRLAPMVGLEAPMRPERGQIVVTERLRPFLNHPVVTLRQTDEGTVMIGDSKEESVDPSGLTIGVSATEAERAVRQFPLLANVNVVRTWSAIRVMTQDGFPIYDESQTHPGAFTVCCHSGVTLAANHALTIAPMIARGALDASLVAPFSARRFHVQAAG
ncbi:FAD-dependent oxidoreductase [Reyranella sp.]|jgi:glycine/D-amino acid oxidase-like deaminating enzyme|uniref:NAD(P)/FAD-dependent oxidoreductase n=1 Tax=Reyranella sp. TaxID=1929291 RepID=UPI000BC51F24|nr:FAD-dependent oxidoreductase [Reyranella sp.]OYY40624.1 MAG: FAD-dependent oxidoreductase [Rhodospirillales bacterium 35-66-84]OYZ93184.1 MAG: FAD-dependent oxidoreductase [Rhodospirillales bacterium 24-66-33]OZB24580.1 MAG: FAD-dependent oxidoreductase [Rhodospirillales bacterium 39-66-50]HQS18101.1 FAD-dependent oxidoreductase [Reyranella sp.]HQT14676.1 FAD-dependent oxidoreductase [Reyranella sp.]